MFLFTKAKRLIHFLISLIKKMLFALDKAFGRVILRVRTEIYNRQPLKEQMRRKYLYASPVGHQGKENLAEIIQTFGYDDFDYLIFVYDQTKFPEEIYHKCRFIYEPGLKWYYAKKYLTPQYCQPYSYLFFWDDDIKIDEFSYERFIQIMVRNRLELAHPALSPDSTYANKIDLKDERYLVGRYTDFVEIMAQVFTQDAWGKYWGMIENDWNYWGWGYTHIATSFCGYHNTGFIDCETVRHPNPVRKWNPDDAAPKECQLFLEKNKHYRQTRFLIYGGLK